MADNTKFGSPKVLQFGDKTAINESGDNGHCAQCEAMLTDAVDGTLSAADQELFDLHVANCGPCAQLVADARRGAAWLEMLRTPAPEPPADLLGRILAQTSFARMTAETGQMVPLGMQPSGFPGAALANPQDGIAAVVYGSAIVGPGTHANVIPFPRRAVAAVRTSSFGQIMLQPRLAMTAAMAFFSIALTLNLTGIHPMSLRASDFQPSSLKHDYHAANARVVRYYEGLRVVYELESRVHDLQSATDNDPAAGTPSNGDQRAPTAQPGPANQKAAPQGPGKQSPDPQAPDKQAPGNQPAGSKPQPAKPAPSPGTSRREDPNQRRRLFVACNRNDCGIFIQTRVGRKLV